MNNHDYTNQITVVITTFFAGEKLDHCLDRLPKKISKIIIDNGNEFKNKTIYEQKYENLNYIIPKGNIGIPSSYQMAWKHVKTKYMFQTQPDVLLNNDCIQELYAATKNYPNAAIFSPIIFHDKKYEASGNFFFIKYDARKKKITNKIIFNKIYDDLPTGDFSVDAVSATAMLIDTDKLGEINGWDTNIFAYFEDVDLCLRFKLQGYEVVKVKKAKLDHQAFSSHDKKFHRELEFSRNFHYCWSRVYFMTKYEGFIKGKLLSLGLIFKFIAKIIIYIIFLKKKKLSLYAPRLFGTISSLISLRSFYRPNL